MFICLYSQKYVTRVLLWAIVCVCKIAFSFRLADGREHSRKPVIGKHMNIYEYRLTVAGANYVFNQIKFKCMHLADAFI